MLSKKKKKRRKNCRITFKIILSKNVGVDILIEIESYELQSKVFGLIPRKKIETKSEFVITIYSPDPMTQ